MQRDMWSLGSAGCCGGTAVGRGQTTVREEPVAVSCSGCASACLLQRAELRSRPGLQATKRPFRAPRCPGLASLRGKSPPFLHSELGTRVLTWQPVRRSHLQQR